MKRPRKRTLLMVLLLLLGGAIINVAVAWGCAALIHPQLGSVDVTFRQLSEEEFRAYSTISGFGRSRVSFYPGKRKERQASKSGLPEIDWTPIGKAGSSDYAGWPCFSLTCSKNGPVVFMVDGYSTWAFNGDPNAVLDGGFPLLDFACQRMGNPWRALPYKPVWLGFAINTIFYAAIFWLLFAGPGRLRRFIRTKRGLCPACGYDLRGQPPPDSDAGRRVCPECGKPVTPRQT
jgi:hypothetical protein